MTNFTQAFGRQLKALRKQKNFTQEKLSELIHINQRQLARIESGASFVTAHTIENICTSLEITVRDLFNFEIYQQPLMVANGHDVVFNVVRCGNILEFKPKGVNSQQEYRFFDNDADKRMLKLAENLGEPILVEEIIDGHCLGLTTYYPDGRIDDSKSKETSSTLENINQELKKISTQRNKLEFIELAIMSLYDKSSLKELKTIIKGLELSM